MNRYLYILALVTLCIYSISAKAESYTLFTAKLPPYADKVGNQLTGVAIDIVSQLFKNSGIQFKVEIVPWKRAYNAALSEMYSCVFPAQRSQEREVLFQWVSPILISHSGFYTKQNSPFKIRTLNDVKKLTIGTYLGSATALYLTSQGFKAEQTIRDSQNIHKLDKNRIDVWATDTMVGNYLIESTNMRGRIKKQLEYLTTLRGLACNKNTPPEVIDKLSKELKIMYETGAIESIIQKHTSL
ncbi:ABC transporter substrate-binding protein [Vibrio profundum]|uniref:substrate-binding periplasmic protein n=1 Tax=Vibrio profundum TaxID=2910247 RepID=UPI003D0C8B1B